MPTREHGVADVPRVDEGVLAVEEGAEGGEQLGVVGQRVEAAQRLHVLVPCPG